ncbi:MAG: hypothetical protein RSD19_08125 [Oscillospiraceae bacterium]
MATLHSIRESLSKASKFRKAIAYAKRMRDLLGDKGSLFMTFALTGLNKLKADKSLSAEEFSKRVDAELDVLYGKYLKYRYPQAVA